MWKMPAKDSQTEESPLCLIESPQRNSSKFSIQGYSMYKSHILFSLDQSNCFKLVLECRIGIIKPMNSHEYIHQPLFFIWTLEENK